MLKFCQIRFRICGDKISRILLFNLPLHKHFFKLNFCSSTSSKATYVSSYIFTDWLRTAVAWSVNSAVSAIQRYSYMTEWFKKIQQWPRNIFKTTSLLRLYKLFSWWIKGVNELNHANYLLILKNKTLEIVFSSWLPSVFDIVMPMTPRSFFHQIETLCANTSANI